MNIAAFIIRIILSVLLLVGVYSETGLWTTVALTLMFINSEAAAWALSMLRARS